VVGEIWQFSCRCLTRYFAVLVERRVVGEMAIFANHHKLRRPLLTTPSARPFLSDCPVCYPTLVAYNAQLLPSPSTANPSHSLVTIDTRPILLTNSCPISKTRKNRHLSCLPAAPRHQNKPSRRLVITVPLHEFTASPQKHHFSHRIPLRSPSQDKARASDPQG